MSPHPSTSSGWFLDSKNPHVEHVETWEPIQRIKISEIPYKSRILGRVRPLGARGLRPLSPPAGALRPLHPNRWIQGPLAGIAKGRSPLAREAKRLDLRRRRRDGREKQSCDYIVKVLNPSQTPSNADGKPTTGLGRTVRLITAHQHWEPFIWAYKPRAH